MIWLVASLASGLGVAGGTVGALWASRNNWRDDARQLHEQLLECREGSA